VRVEGVLVCLVPQDSSVVVLVFNDVGVGDLDCIGSVDSEVLRSNGVSLNETPACRGCCGDNGDDGEWCFRY
jgi:hypothetical protein